MAQQLNQFDPVYPGLESTPALIHHAARPKLLSSDVRLIISVVGSTSIITHLCQHAIRHAAEYIRAYDLTLADYDRFVEYLRERSVVGAVAPQAVAPDESGRDKGAGKRAPSAKGERPKSRKDAAR